ncbi:MAG: hypothetical protein L0229_12635 [Blastocatellia bacterium]|nr:hypothetical protein [Blastocatellia bacterium]
MKTLPTWLLPVFLAILSTACSDTARAPEGVGATIQKLKADHAAIVVIRQANDYYWAIPVPGIKEAGKTNITVEAGTLIAGGSGKGNPDDIAQILMDQRTGRGPYFSSMHGGATASGQVETTKAIKTFEVEEIIFPKRPATAPASK